MADMLTDAELAAIKKRREAATLGLCLFHAGPASAQVEADLDFFGHACSDIPALLAHVEAQATRIRELEAAAFPERAYWLDLTRLQEELAPWVEHNFPGRPAWQPLLGLAEEVGELSHHFLKREQSIRSAEDHAAEIRDAVGDIIVFLADFANAESLSLQSCLEEVWAKVRQRDWQAERRAAEALKEEGRE